MTDSVLRRLIWRGAVLDEGTLEWISGSFPVGGGYSFDQVVIWIGIIPTIKN